VGRCRCREIQGFRCGPRVGLEVGDRLDEALVFIDPAPFAGGGGGGVARCQRLHLERNLHPGAVVIVPQGVPKLDALTDSIAKLLLAILPGERDQRPAMDGGESLLGNGSSTNGPVARAAPKDTT